jgi:hypothetical protein
MGRLARQFVSRGIRIILAMALAYGAVRCGRLVWQYAFADRRPSAGMGVFLFLLAALVLAIAAAFLAMGAILPRARFTRWCGKPLNIPPEDREDWDLWF